MEERRQEEQRVELTGILAGMTDLLISLPFYKCPEAFLPWNIFANSKNNVIKFDSSTFTIF